jgi:hypothetical protein
MLSHHMRNATCISPTLGTPHDSLLSILPVPSLADQRVRRRDHPQKPRRVQSLVIVAGGLHCSVTLHIWAQSRGICLGFRRLDGVGVNGCTGHVGWRSCML